MIIHLYSIKNFIYIWKISNLIYSKSKIYMRKIHFRFILSLDLIYTMNYGSICIYIGKTNFDHCNFGRSRIVLYFTFIFRRSEKMLNLLLILNIMIFVYPLYHIYTNSWKVAVAYCRTCSCECIHSIGGIQYNNTENFLLTNSN